MAAVLVGVPGVTAVALGGSRAHGTHHEGSDVDLGVYYRPGELDVAALSLASARFSDSGRVEVTGPGGWGPWVDGGGWLTVEGTAVDWILRDVDRVRQQVDRARAGHYAFHAQPGHPLGFLDISYAGEVASCHPLADPDGVIAALRADLHPYPAALRRAFVDDLWQAGFLVDAARKGVPKDDLTYVLLCCTGALMRCAHAWHAAAGVWATNEKGIVVDVARLGLDTVDFTARADAALRRCSDTDLVDAIDTVASIVDDTRTALA